MKDDTRPKRMGSHATTQVKREEFLCTGASQLQLARFYANGVRETGTSRSVIDELFPTLSGLSEAED